MNYMMQCPECGCKTRVINIRSVFGAVYRRRECTECKFRFYTEELETETCPKGTWADKRERKERLGPGPYGLHDISQFMGVTYRTVWNYVKAGKLKAVKVGKYWKVTEENYKKFISGE